MSFVPTVAQNEGVGAGLAGHVGSDTGIGGGGRGQHRSVRVGGAQDVGDAAVVGPEIADPSPRWRAPRRSPAGRVFRSDCRARETGIGQALRGHWENIEIACA